MNKFYVNVMPKKLINLVLYSIILEMSPNKNKNSFNFDSKTSIRQLDIPVIFYKTKLNLKNSNKTPFKSLYIQLYLY